MSMKNFDVVILGVGGIGSAAAYFLAEKKVSVLGIEQFTIPHDRGSSHGRTRIIRKAYFEHENYIPLLKRTYTLWEMIEKKSGEKLFHKNGLLVMGEESSIVSKIKSAALKYKIDFNELGSQEIRNEFPLFKVPDSFEGVFEKDAGYLEVEKCVATLSNLSKKSGAEIHENETLIEFKEEREHIKVITNRETYLTRKLVITLGPWAPLLLKNIGMEITSWRVPQFWFEAKKDYEKLPCFAFHIWDEFIYGFPSLPGTGLKMARYAPHEIIPDASRLDCTITPDMLSWVQRCMKEYLPELNRNPIESSMCMYTLSKDGHFIVDRHPESENIYFATGCSGHAFKFVPVLGELLSDLTLEGSSKLPYDFLKIRSLTH